MLRLSHIITICFSSFNTIVLDFSFGGNNICRMSDRVKIFGASSALVDLEEISGLRKGEYARLGPKQRNKF